MVPFHSDGQRNQRKPMILRGLSRASYIVIFTLTWAAESRRLSFVHNPSTKFKLVSTHHINALLQSPTGQQIVKVSSILRGGASVDDVEEEFEEEDEDEDFDEDEDDDAALLDDLDDDSLDSAFADGSAMDRLSKMWAKTPPVTKAYLTASFTVAAFGMLFNKNQFPDIMLWDTKKVLTRLQLWRPFTSFLNFGPLGLSYVLTVQFVWVYMSTLERLNHNRPYDFWIMLLFGMTSMVIGYPILKLSPRFLGHNLSTFLVYIWSRYHEGVEVNMFDMLTVKAELLPWLFLAQTYLLEGEPPILDFLGIIFGHIYHHCKTIGILQAPDSLTAWYEKSDAASSLRELYKPISSDFDAV